MFSEYASRFLAQSQSRLLPNQTDTDSPRHPSNRPVADRRSSSRQAGTRSYMQRGNMPNPYNPSASQMSRFPFASRLNAPAAPLFYSAADDFREQDDNEEYERERADMHALQKSRRNFEASHLTESDELEDASERSLRGRGYDSEAPRFTRGIKSSWRGDKLGRSMRGRDPEPITPSSPINAKPSSPLAIAPGSPFGNDRGNLVDVELASTVHSERRPLVDDVSDHEDENERPPAVQHFRTSPRRMRSPLRVTLPIPQETDEEEQRQHPALSSPEDNDSEVSTPQQIERHDFFWANLFIICQCATVGAFFLILAQTSTPTKLPLGDTIYTVLRSSYHLLGVYSLVSVIVSFLWLALLRSFARPLINLILVAVPIILFSFFLYPFVSSYKGRSEGASTQDSAMRWLSFVPLLVAGFWSYTVWKGRHSVARSTELLEFTGKILTAMTPLLLVGMATLSAVVLYTWLWIWMFTRLFLEGHFTTGKKTLFIIDTSTWWLGIGFTLEYLWTLGVITGLQRAATAATVSQWYFHRNAQPRIPSHTVVRASSIHAATTMLGSICLSTLLSLIIRAPLLVLPRRLAGALTMCIYSLIPASIATLTNPLTLTYASVHSQPLRTAANNLSQMSFVSHDSPTMTLTPRSFQSRSDSSLLPYRLAKLLLHALRFIMSLALGFGGWVSTARMLQINVPGGESLGYKGSAYAYVVGLIAAAIGWGVLGAMEGVMGGILDALVICWGSEVGVHGLGEVRYCREAGQLLSDAPVPDIRAPRRS